MIYLTNKRTGGLMLVADDRKDEYLAAGHKPAVFSSTKKPAEEKPKKKKNGV